MRLSIEDLTGDDPEKAAMVFHCDVLLDGQPCGMCIMADEEKGEVEVRIPRDDPRWQKEFKETNEWPTEMKYGKVVIVDRRKKDVLHA